MIEFRAFGSKLRFVRNTTKRSRAGSTQSSVPVHPVCPKASGLSSRPKTDVGSSYVGSGESQPSNREPAFVAGVRNSRIVSAFTHSVPSARRPSRSHACAYRARSRSEEHTSELQSRLHLVCRLLLEKKKNNT